LLKEFTEEMVLGWYARPAWENKLLFPPVVKAQRKESPMKACLAAMDKRVSELREAGLKAYHYIKEFHHRWIHPLGRQDKYAYECPRMADPNREPEDGKLSIVFETLGLSRFDISLVLYSFVSGRGWLVHGPIVR
jgi:hypothetical protein